MELDSRASTANRVALLIGGNQGDRWEMIAQALRLVGEHIGKVVASSAIYETAPWGDFGDEQPLPFLNQALLVETRLDAHAVLCAALDIEARLGRQRVAGKLTYSSRPMDIDVIFFNDEVIDMPGLQVPHPRMHLRRFVLEPLAEIMPQYVHPVLNKTVTELLADCS